MITIERSAVALLGCCLLASCATVTPGVEFKGSWPEDPAKDRVMREKIDALTPTLREPRPEADAVDVVVGAIPEGIKLEGNVLSVEKGAPFEILGRAVVVVGGDGSFFPDYEDGWRKGLCYWQLPLMVATLMVWGAVPTSYPCWVGHTESKESVLRMTKNFVHSVGGQLFIGGYLYSDQQSAAGMEGFVIRRLVAPAKPEPATESL